jgi:uncharacterized membrane-anchored protein YhcB (DUF1043 family)
MRRGFLAWIIDRAQANSRGVKTAPEAFVVLAIIAFGIPYFALRQSYGERLAVLQSELTAQRTALADYRTKLKGASPEQAAAQIEKLAASAADMQKHLNEQKNQVVSPDHRPRDPQRLYADDNPIALVQDAKVDLPRKKVTFPVVTSGIFLAMDTTYEFQNWKLACGGTQSYSEFDDGGGHAFSYSHLSCKIVGGR